MIQRKLQGGNLLLCQWSFIQKVKVKADLKDTYLGGTTPQNIQNEVSICQLMYYNNEKCFMVNQSVNEFKNRLLLNIDAITKGEVFTMDSKSTFFNRLSTDIRELLVS